MVGRTEGLDFCTVRSGRRAIDMLRMLSFGSGRSSACGFLISLTWDFVRRVRTGWAWQKWALVGGAITEQQEITARMFGSVKIYDVMPSSDEVLQLASHLREKGHAVGSSIRLTTGTTVRPPRSKPSSNAMTDNCPQAGGAKRQKLWRPTRTGLFDCKCDTIALTTQFRRKIRRRNPKRRESFIK